MKLATIFGGGRDGVLVLVDDMAGRVAIPPAGPQSLRVAIEDWAIHEESLQQASEALRNDRIPSLPIDGVHFMSPLPRTFTWCEGSTYLSHMERIRGMRGISLPSDHGWKPGVYQSGGAVLHGPNDDIKLPDKSWDLDVEGTIAVVTDDVAIGLKAEEASSHIRLLLLVNDLTYRALIPEEYERRLGIFKSKPARSIAPFAVTPDEFGDAWDGNLLASQVQTKINGELIGSPDSSVDCAFDFPRLLEQIAISRALPAGSMIGTGTVSNYASDTGYGCIAEKRAAEIASFGSSRTEYLQPGDSYSIEAFVDGRSAFGAIDQKVKQA